MNDKQKKFAEEYILSSNATKAAIIAGYSEKTAYSQGQRLLKNVEIKKYISEAQNDIKNEMDIRKADVIQALKDIGLSDIQIDKIKASDKIKALELISKLLGFYNTEETTNEKVNQNTLTLAELINNPHSNRNISDFEE